MCTCMYSISVFLEYVYGFMRIIVLSVCITYGSSYVSFPTSQYLVLEYVYGFMRIIVLSVCITCGSSYVSFPRSHYHVLTLRFY